ncbi:SRPBCC family protein [Geodermatophilus sp. CPCC 206100]|uniref:SRPBCC family protein n=1 Tax=Geodermatophilus sp. CPCC 206100 TaxID=3020054 RepID=UPI003B00A474
MPELVETVDVAAPPERVWAALTDWTRQGEWMLLTDVEVVGATTQGVGARLAARTGLPWRRGRHVGVLDTMVVTEWDPPRRVVVQHTGRVVRGPGIFVVTPRGTAATLEWTERLYLPLGLLGRAGWPLVRPFVVVGIRRSLRRFAAFAAAHPG